MIKLSAQNFNKSKNVSYLRRRDKSASFDEENDRFRKSCCVCRASGYLADLVPSIPSDRNISASLSLNGSDYHILPAIRSVQRVVFATIIATEATRKILFVSRCGAVLIMNPSTNI